MKNLKNDIDKSIDMIKNNISYGNKDYSPIILFYNENGKAKNNIFNYEGKKVLCPTASGDQYLTAKFYNAKEIITYDINKLTKYITDLKIASIKALDYEEFLLFMIPNLLGRPNEYFLSEKLLKKVSLYLNVDNITYWNEIISSASKNGYNSLIELDNACYKEDDIKRECLFYSIPESYKILKRKLLKESFYEVTFSDIRELKLSDSFDIIDLSNIISSMIIESFYNEIYDYSLEELSRKYIEFIDKQILPFVNHNGNILVDYQIGKGRCIDKLYFNSDKYTSHKIESKKQNNLDIILKYRKS